MTAPLLGAVIGSPVSHSLSPAIYSAAFAARGLDARYDAVETGADDCCATLARLVAEGARAISVTMPLKESVGTCLDRIDDDARLLNSVNCVSVATDGALTGHTTDGDGCCDALEQQGGASLSGSRAVVLGAGGAARSVVLALVRHGAHVTVVNRSADRADELVALLSGIGPGTASTGRADSIAGASILVNTTSVGMNSSDVPVDASVLHGGLVVLDAVYQPMETALIASARAVGATVVDGLWMLIQQARRQCVHQFGWTPDAAPMRAAAEAVLALRANRSGSGAPPPVA